MHTKADASYKAARKLRAQGMSIRSIEKKLSLPRSTVSAWCRDIVLSEEQHSNLYKHYGFKDDGRRERANAARKKNVLARWELAKEKGRNRVENIDETETLFLGLGLYMGDGAKTQNRVIFSNGNVALQKFMKAWLMKYFGIENERLICRVAIHEKYKNEAEAIISEWSHVLSIPEDQFTPITYIKSTKEPKFIERGTYKGTMALIVRASTDILLEILGMADALVYKGSTTRPG